MSSFDEKPAFKKFVVTASLTAEQREEFDALKTFFGLKTDGALIKRGLAELAHAVEAGSVDIGDSDDADESDDDDELDNVVAPDPWTPATA